MIRPCEDSGLVTINNNTIKEPKLVLVDHHPTESHIANEEDSFDKVSLESYK